MVSDQRSKVIDYYDIYHYETNMDSSTYSYTNDLVGFDAEGQLTSAIEYVTMDSDKLPIVYQITGHDETTVGSAFEDAIKKANMTLSSIELLNEESVPEDASAIIINAPQKDFNEKDAQKVIDYLKDGGKAIIVGSYTENKLPNFDKILDTYKVSITDGVISENDAQHYYQTGGPLYILPEVNSSSYTSNIGGNYIYLPITCGITYPDSTDTMTYTSLMNTSDSAVCKNDPNNMKDYGYEDGDEKGPFSIGLAVEDKVDDDTTTQLLVFGSSYIFSDQATDVTANNVTLFSDAVKGLVGESDDAGSVIPEKEYTLSNLTVSAMYAILLGLSFTIVVPIILLILGIVIFMVRRKK